MACFIGASPHWGVMVNLLQWQGFLGRSLPYEVQNHVLLNFAAPMLYTKNHSKFHRFFWRAIKPLEFYFVKFWTSYSSIWNLYIFFCNFFCCYNSKWWMLQIKEIVKFYYHTLVCKKYIFDSLHGNFLIIIWLWIRCLLEGISFGCTRF